jgi:hypothetical protein
MNGKDCSLKKEPWSKLRRSAWLTTKFERDDASGRPNDEQSWTNSTSHGLLSVYESCILGVHRVGKGSSRSTHV